MVQPMPDNTDLEFLALQEALVGRYSLDRELGRGGMGIVYLAHEVALDRPVGLKLLPPKYAAQPRLRERFMREAQTAARLSHPNIVPIYAVDEVNDFVFFTMAYIDGESLAERIEARGALPASEATRILREIAWALAYGHAHGVVHRDVKPDNILLEKGSERALLTDFGIAQVTEGAAITGVDDILGTAEFMSPEQAAGDPVDERSDLYSLAIVGHYMLTGKFPFRGETVAATLAKQITQPAPALIQVAPEIPADLAKAMDRCLEKDPGARFADGEELANALGRALQVRREIPVPLRVFWEHNRERFRGLGAISLFGGTYFLFSLWVILVEGDLGGLIATGIALLLAAGPAGLLFRMARNLLAQGYSRQELILAIEADLDARREELTWEQRTATSWLDRISVSLTAGGLAVAAAATGAMVFGDLSFEMMRVMGITAAFSGLAALIGAPVAVTRAARRKKLPGGRWLRFWKSRMGEALFRVAGWRLEPVSAGAGAHRPTEMAISMAADRLYAELPPELRRDFRELPGVVRGLEAEAEKMRSRVKELDRLIDDFEHGADRPSAERDAVGADLGTARVRAARRLTRAVSALERIRLQLLRLHAGAGSVEALTRDLGAAREMADDIEHLLTGREEVDRLLMERDTAGHV